MKNKHPSLEDVKKTVGVFYKSAERSDRQSAEDAIHDYMKYTMDYNDHLRHRIEDKVHVRMKYSRNDFEKDWEILKNLINSNEEEAGKSLLRECLEAYCLTQSNANRHELETAFHDYLKYITAMDDTSLRHRLQDSFREILSCHEYDYDGMWEKICSLSDISSEPVT